MKLHTSSNLFQYLIIYTSFLADRQPSGLNQVMRPQPPVARNNQCSMNLQPNPSYRRTELVHGETPQGVLVDLPRPIAIQTPDPVYQDITSQGELYSEGASYEDTASYVISMRSTENTGSSGMYETII